jgi:hypothetical protein
MKSGRAASVLQPPHLPPSRREGQISLWRVADALRFKICYAVLVILGPGDEAHEAAGISLRSSVERLLGILRARAAAQYGGDGIPQQYIA